MQSLCTPRRIVLNCIPRVCALSFHLHQANKRLFQERVKVGSGGSSAKVMALVLIDSFYLLEI